MLVPMAPAIAFDEFEWNAAAQARAVGKTVASCAVNPVRHSTWAMAGMPSRLLSINSRFIEAS